MADRKIISYLPQDKEVFNELFEILEEIDSLQRRPAKTTIKAGESKRLVIERPLRHKMVIYNTSNVDLFYGAMENDEIIPFPANSKIEIQPHNFIIWKDIHMEFTIEAPDGNVYNIHGVIEDMPVQITHADWPWDLWIKNPSATDATIIYYEIY
jgi:hypothetical protein